MVFRGENRPLWRNIRVSATTGPAVSLPLWRQLEVTPIFASTQAGLTHVHSNNRTDRVFLSINNYRRHLIVHILSIVVSVASGDHKLNAQPRVLVVLT